MSTPALPPMALFPPCFPSLHFFPLYMYLLCLIPSLQPDPSPHHSNCHPLQPHSFLPLLFLHFCSHMFPCQMLLLCCGTHLSSWVVSLDLCCGNPTSSISYHGVLGTSCNISNESIKVALNLLNIHYVMEQKNQPLDWFTYLSSPCIWWIRCMSCTIRVCHLVWIAAKLESIKRPTR